MSYRSQKHLICRYKKRVRQYPNHVDPAQLRVRLGNMTTCASCDAFVEGRIDVPNIELLARLLRLHRRHTDSRPSAHREAFDSDGSTC